MIYSGNKNVWSNHAIVTKMNFIDIKNSHIIVYYQVLARMYVASVIAYEPRQDIWVVANAAEQLPYGSLFCPCVKHVDGLKLLAAFHCM